MGFVKFIEDLGLDADKFSITVYRFSDDCDRDWRDWSRKHPGRGKGGFWRAQLNEVWNRRIRRSMKEANRASRERAI